MERGCSKPQSPYGRREGITSESSSKRLMKSMSSVPLNFFFKYIFSCFHCYCLVAKSCQTLLWSHVACQAPLSMGFPRQEYWSGLPFPFPGGLPDLRIKSSLLHPRQILYHWTTGEVHIFFLVLWWFNFSFMSDSCGPMDCSPQGSSDHGISQARILEWAAISFSRGSSWPSDRTRVSCVAGGLLHCRWILYQLSHQGSPS